MRWVENRWVLPDEAGGRWVFHEVDIARVELILHVRHDFAVGDDAMPVVLGLLDQVYSLRRQMTPAVRRGGRAAAGRADGDPAGVAEDG